MATNLSNEYREIAGEVKKLVKMSAANSDMFTMDSNELAMSIKALHLLNRLVDLFGDVFEKQDKLMDKMDKVMDAYLENR